MRPPPVVPSRPGGPPPGGFGGDERAGWGPPGGRAGGGVGGHCLAGDRAGRVSGRGRRGALVVLVVPVSGECGADVGADERQYGGGGAVGGGGNGQCGGITGANGGIEGADGLDAAVFGAPTARNRAKSVSWRLARALGGRFDEGLLGEVNNSAPKRSKVSDGGVGDTRHAARKSEHNTCKCCSVVC